MKTKKLDSYGNVKPFSQKLTKLPKPQELNNPRGFLETQAIRSLENLIRSKLKRMFRVTTTVLLLTLAKCLPEIPTLVVIHLFLTMVVAILDL
ncbi:hypothetical protein TNIN_225271 [Trichonephila inaurata madagascariensis]|uniref:Uncharacterized protein n=1 Tax=Trichonephila inaurata madagascariensis TaxID=2747483 RepID=A0A8X6Y778_9ARAC|nr:hypothetical protein TNIN_225271 [Trichonephila inaurata madagascariensis]